VASDAIRAAAAARRILSSLGLYQIITYSLINHESLRRVNFPADNVIAVSNPISYEQEIMRSTLVPGIVTTYINNLNKKIGDVRIFELGKVYFKTSGGSREQVNLAVGIAGCKFDDWLRKKSEVGFYDLKGILETLFISLGVADYVFRAQEFPALTEQCSAAVVVGGRLCGFAGQLNQRAVFKRSEAHQDIFIAELNFDELCRHARPDKQYRELTRYPAVTRDLSLVVNRDISCQSIIDLIKKFGVELVSGVKVFDLYSGEQIPPDSQGLSLSIEFQAGNRTLTAEEVEKIFQKIKSALQEKLKVQIR
jgi:phenylalanyl-tRNA synthetase beta chain